MESVCICQKKSKFSAYITYKNEPAFRDYEGIIIGKCTQCNILKTFSSKTIPSQSHLETYNKNIEKFRELFQPIISLVKKYKPAGKILDVGCANGLLMTVLKDSGYEVFGIEPNSKAFEQAQHKFKNRVFNGMLKEYIRKHTSKYDVIIYNHVMEHIPDINKEIHCIKQILRPGGIIIIGVPNTNNVVFKLRKKYWESLLPLEHIWHFSDIYLKNYLTQKGFTILDLHHSNHTREDYPILKRVYFSLLTIINRLMGTGEAVLIAARL